VSFVEVVQMSMHHVVTNAYVRAAIKPETLGIDTGQLFSFIKWLTFLISSLHENSCVFVRGPYRLPAAAKA
jgi:hypothetical protein